MPRTINSKETALEILGLDPSKTYDEELVSAVYRDCLREAHPDTNPDADKEQCAERIEELKQARDYLKPSSTVSKDNNDSGTSPVTQSDDVFTTLESTVINREKFVSMLKKGVKDFSSCCFDLASFRGSRGILVGSDQTSFSLSDLQINGVGVS